MPTTMPGMWVTASGALEVRDLPVPEIGEQRLLLRTLASAVCGSDLHRFRGADSYGFDTDVFGHESIGEVVRCASGAFSPGDRVLHVPFPAEGKVFAPFQVARETNVLPVPSTLDPEIAVFAQQLGTVVYALKQFWSDPVPPTTAFVAGAGPAGLLFVQLLRRMGCERVVVSEPDEFRRGLAARFGAVTDTDVSDVDLSVDTSGTPEGRRSCFDRTRRRGTMGVFGLPDDEPGDLMVSVLELMSRDLRLIGAKGAQSEPGLVSFHEAIALLSDGTVEVADLITHRVGLTELGATCELAAHLTGPVAKVLTVFDLEEQP